MGFRGKFARSLLALVITATAGLNTGTVRADPSVDLPDGSLYMSPCSAGMHPHCNGGPDDLLFEVVTCPGHDGETRGRCMRRRGPKEQAEKDRRAQALADIQRCRADPTKKDPSCDRACFGHIQPLDTDLGLCQDVIIARKIPIGDQTVPIGDPAPPAAPPVVTPAQGASASSADDGVDPAREKYCTSQYPDKSSKLYKKCLSYDCTLDPAKKHTPGCIAWARAHKGRAYVRRMGLDSPPVKAPQAPPPDAHAEAQKFVNTLVQQYGGAVDDEVKTGEVPDTERRGRYHIRDATAPLVDISPLGIHGGTHYTCPDWVAPYNCFPRDGKWTTDPVTGEHVDLNTAGAGAVKDLFTNLKPVLYAELGQYAVEVAAEAYMAGLVATAPEHADEVREKAQKFLASASCVRPETATRLKSSIDAMLSQPKLAERLRLHRNLKLGPDMIAVSHRMAEAKKVIDTNEPRLKLDGDCGWPTSQDKPECTRIFEDLQAARYTYEDAAANYPFLMLKVDGKRGFDAIDAVEGSPGQRIQNALHVYDRLVKQSMDASLKKVTDLCSNEQHLEDAGEAAMFNPMIAQAYMNGEPQSAWVFCGAYAQINQKKEIKKTLKEEGEVLFTAASMLFTGGVSGVIFAGANVGLVGLEFMDRKDTAYRDRADYLAGVGSVDKFLAAEDAMKHFYRDLAIQEGVAAGGFAFSMYSEAGTLRSWMVARRIAAGSAEAARSLTPEANAAMVAWYRTRATELLGPAADQLSDAEITELARMEDAGADLSQLKARLTGCVR